jgi:hypothetical protein
MKHALFWFVTYSCGTATGSLHGSYVSGIVSLLITIAGILRQRSRPVGSLLDTFELLAHFLRDPGAEGVQEQDHLYFRGVVEMHERILPAVKELREKINDALNDTKAWSSDPR